MNVVVTDFGMVQLGPKFSALFAAEAEGLTRRKNSKAYKSAKATTERMERAVVLMAEMCYRAGIEFGGTP